MKIPTQYYRSRAIISSKEKRLVESKFEIGDLQHPAEKFTRREIQRTRR